MVLINAVKQQQAEIELEQAQIETLRTANAAVNAELQAIERTLMKNSSHAFRWR